MTESLPWPPSVRTPIFTPQPYDPDAIDLSAIHREKTRAEHYARVARARDGASHGK